jgi:hypothetical protein
MKERERERRKRERKKRQFREWHFISVASDTCFNYVDFEPTTCPTREASDGFEETARYGTRVTR